jgi:hypothetical protein
MAVILKLILTISFSSYGLFSAIAEKVIILKEQDIIGTAEKALRDCLRDPSFVQSINIDKESSEGGSRPDFSARIATSDGEKIVYAEVKANGQPRYARQAINQLILQVQKLPDSYGVFVAPYISPSSARLLREAGIGYVDFAGNCLLNFGHVYVNIEGRGNPFPQNRDLHTLFSPKTSRIMRVLLNTPFTDWKMDSLSREARVSLGLVAEAKKLLLDREWIEEKVVGFALIKPGELLREWSAQYAYRKNKITDLYSIKDETTIEQEIRQFCSKNDIRFALTLFSGASRVAPYARFRRVYVYVQGDTEGAQRALNLKSVDSGPNVTLLDPYDEGIFYGVATYGGMPVVSPIQLYLDLKGYKGRGEEAAEFFFEKVIEPSWLQKQTTVNAK